MQKIEKVRSAKKKSFSRYLLACVKWAVLVLACLIILGFAYQQIATAVTANKYSPKGELIDIGDYRLHYVALGEAHGKPTIILESGLGTPSSTKDWEVIQAELAQYTRVISYDRAGYGWSDEAGNERTSEQIADDLYAMLSEIGESGPFILVGHSFGGFTSQVFANKYSNAVAGIVLVDSSHVDQEGGFSKVEAYAIRFLKEIGIGRVLGLINLLPMHEHFLSDEASIHFFHQRYYNADQISELLYMMTASVEQVRKVQENGYGELPLIILSAEHEEYPEWSELQARTAALSTNGKHSVVKDASHFIHLDQPELVLDAVFELLQMMSE